MKLRPGSASRFFVLAYAITWVAWLPMLLDPDRWGAMHYVGSLGPAVAAVVLTAVDRGRTGLRDLARRMTSGPPRWVLLAIALPVLLFAVGAGLSALLGNPVDPTRLLGFREYPGVGWLVIPIEIVFFGYGEEVGWRGYALDALEAPGRSAYAATTRLALFWAGWHLPLFLYADGLASLPLLMIPGWFLSILFGAYLVTWFYRSSRNSLLVVAVLHGVIDLVSITPAATTVTLIVINAGLIATAVFVVVRWAPRLDLNSAVAPTGDVLRRRRDVRP
jgi:hypothetical protein